MKPWVSPFSTARPTLVMGRVPIRAGLPELRTSRFGQADAAERRVDVEGVAGDAVADPAAVVVEEIGGDDFKVVVGGVGEGAFAVAIAQGPDARRRWFASWSSTLM